MRWPFLRLGGVSYEMDQHRAEHSESIRAITSDTLVSLEIRNVTVSDAAGIRALVRDCDVLDKNSCYAYLLLCRDFADTSLAAVSDGQLCGFVTAYIPPSRPDVLFVWQIGTAPAARGMGVAKQLLRTLLSNCECRGIRFLEATVSPSNTASARLFQSLAEELSAGFNVAPGFETSDFGPVDDGGVEHEREDLVRIGPLKEHHENV